MPFRLNRGKRLQEGSTRPDLSNPQAAPIENFPFELIGERGPSPRHQCSKDFGERTLLPALGAVIDLERDAKPELR